MAVKYWPYRWFLSRIDAHLYVGCANYRYLRHYGVPPTRLFPVRHFVDNDRFAGAASAARADGSVATLRETWGAGAGTTVLLFAGKLIEKKRPLDFVDAIGRAARRGAPVIGVVVGAGPLEDVLRARVGAADAPVRFAGFQNQTALPGYYAAADCLVLPSDGGETWGLVVNEAMACGVPAIVSDAVGCREDLIENDVTGASYGLADVDALTDAVIACASRSCDAVERMQAAVLERIDQYSCEAAVQGALTALQAVATHRGWS